MLPLEHSVILLTCIKRELVLKTNLYFLLRVAVLHWFYFKQKKIDWISKLDAIISSLICNICSNVYQIEKKVF